MKESQPNPIFTPSPTKQIRFKDGVTRTLNRKERRRLKIYNKDLRPPGPDEKVVSQQFGGVTNARV